MVTLRISANESLLSAALAAYAHVLRCDIAVEVEAEEPAEDSGGVRLTMGETERWLYVSASRGPDEAAAQALSEGACAAVTLDSTPAEFAMALATLIDGGPGYVPIDMVRWMAGEALGRNGNGERSPSESTIARPALTGREREILQRVARGCTNAEIAAELMISTNTVRTHLHALSMKLEATSRARMLANARALAIPEAFEFSLRAAAREQRASA